jgi:hypothetical protein
VTEEYGATVSGGRISFRVRAPRAEALWLCLFEGGSEQRLAMARNGEDWVVEMAGDLTGSLYGYRADVLARWNQLPFSPLEGMEKLEQLRLLEAGIGIGTFAVEGESLSVDTPEQLEEARLIAESLG